MFDFVLRWSFFPLTIVPGLKSKSPYWATFPLVVKNCVSKALGFSSARMLILERILWKDVRRHQQTQLDCLRSDSNCKQKKTTHTQNRCSYTWQVLEEVVFYLEGSLHDLQDIGWVFLQQTNLSDGKIVSEFLLREAHIIQTITLILTLVTMHNSWITEAHRPYSMCRSGWWQQRWGWCCVCPADGPVWVWKGNPGLYPLCICHLRPGGIVRHCAAGCQTARWRRQPRSGRPTRWRKPGDACCGRANRSYPKISTSVKW